MGIPVTNSNPPFQITRSSHIVLTVSDLDESVRFYTEIIGLLVTHADRDVAYLRGVEESAHHSLVLKKTSQEVAVERIGFRVARDQDIDAAASHFKAQGRACEILERPFQGRTLHVADDFGVPVEFVATMPAQPRVHDHPHVQKGAAGLRFDHTQILAPDVSEASRFYTDLGFRISDWFVRNEADEKPLGIFMHRKNNPHDIVFLTRPGPVFHHFGYIVADSTFLLRALDTAGHIGYSHTLERGPARHGEGHAHYVYFRDPDGHRVEILTHPVQLGDAEDVPQKWHSGNRHTWEQPPPKSWLYEGSRFAGVEIKGKGTAPGLRSLEEFLGERVLKPAE